MRYLEDQCINLKRNFNLSEEESNKIVIRWNFTNSIFMNRGVPCFPLDQAISSFFPDEGLLDSIPACLCDFSICAHATHAPHTQNEPLKTKFRSNASTASSPPTLATAVWINRRSLTVTHKPRPRLTDPRGLIPAYIPTSSTSLSCTLCPSLHLLYVPTSFHPRASTPTVPLSRTFFSRSFLIVSSAQMSPESSLLQHLN